MISRTDNENETILALESTFNDSSSFELHLLTEQIVADNRLNITVDAAALKKIELDGTVALAKLFSKVKSIGGQARIVNLRGELKVRVRYFGMAKELSL